MHRTLLLILFLSLLTNACCVNKLNNVSQHHEIYDCGIKKTLINSSAIKEISIQIEPSLSKQLRHLSRQFKFDEIEFIMVFEIKPGTNIDLMNASYTAHLDSNQLFSEETSAKSIEKFNNSILSSNYNLLKSEFEPGQVYSIRFNYKSEKKIN